MDAMPNVTVQRRSTPDGVFEEMDHTDRAAHVIGQGHGAIRFETQNGFMVEQGHEGFDLFMEAFEARLNDEKRSITVYKEVYMAVALAHVQVCVLLAYRTHPFLQNMSV